MEVTQGEVLVESSKEEVKEELQEQKQVTLESLKDLCAFLFSDSTEQLDQNKSDLKALL